MKAIDADALRIVTRGKNHHRKYVLADITDAPTIGAIPVEWLRKKREVAIWQFAAAIDWLLSDWQKEQEAQDGNL